MSWYEFNMDPYDNEHNVFEIICELFAWAIVIGLGYMLLMIIEATPKHPYYGPPQPTREEMCHAKHGSYLRHDHICIAVQEIPL